MNLLDKLLQKYPWVEITLCKRKYSSPFKHWSDTRVFVESTEGGQKMRVNLT